MSRKSEEVAKPLTTRGVANKAAHDVKYALGIVIEGLIKSLPPVARRSHADRDAITHLRNAVNEITMAIMHM